MGEVTAEAKTFVVQMQCDKCKAGFMEPVDGIYYPTNPPKYPHACNNCGHMANYRIRYPYTKTEIKHQTN